MRQSVKFSTFHEKTQITNWSAIAYSTCKFVFSWCFIGLKEDFWNEFLDFSFSRITQSKYRPGRLGARWIHFWYWFDHKSKILSPLERKGDGNGWNTIWTSIYRSSRLPNYILTLICRKFFNCGICSGATGSRLKNSIETVWVSFLRLWRPPNSFLIPGWPYVQNCSSASEKEGDKIYKKYTT